MIAIRPLTSQDITNLPSIRPTYQSSTIFTLVKEGSDLSIQWRLVERNPDRPFDKGTLYDFDAGAQLEIRARLKRTEETYQRVAEEDGKLIGLLDMEFQAWNNSVFLWKLMIDLDYRKQGLGRRLWHRGLEYARQVQARAIMVETQNTNVAACKFYLRMGCQLVGFNEAFYTNNTVEVAGTGLAKVTDEFALFWTYLLADR